MAKLSSLPSFSASWFWFQYWLCFDIDYGPQPGASLLLNNYQSLLKEIKLLLCLISGKKKKQQHWREMSVLVLSFSAL